MKFTIFVKREDDAAAPLTVSEIERTGPLRAASLELTLPESKQLLTRVQQELVQSQLVCHAEEQRICARCGHRRALNDYRTAVFSACLAGSICEFPVSIRVRARTKTRALKRSRSKAWRIGFRPSSSLSKANWPPRSRMHARCASPIAAARRCRKRHLDRPPPCAERWTTTGNRIAGFAGNRAYRAFGSQVKCGHGGGPRQWLGA